MRWTRQRRARLVSQGELILVSDQQARKTSDVVADGEAVWSWHPLLMSSLRRFWQAQPGATNHQSANDGDKKEFVAGESAEETVKTIRVRECRVNLTDLW